MKKDITEYSENELSLIVMNDESLYLERHKPDFIELIDEYFIYTDEQKSVLIEDLADELSEMDDDEKPYFAVLPEHLNEV